MQQKSKPTIKPSPSKASPSPSKLLISSETGLLAEQFPQQDEEHRNQELLQIMSEKARESLPAQRMTWKAMYSLKTMEMELNDQMSEEIERIKDKYQIKRQPLYNQIAAAVLGRPLQAELKQLLEVHGVSAKQSPRPVESFWSTVLEKTGLLMQEIDSQCLRSMTEFNCELVDLATNHYRLTFAFHPSTPYFSNKRLTLSFQRGFSGEILESDSLTYKQNRNDQSLFTLLFDPQTEEEKQSSLQLATQLSQNYSNALYFYFRQQDKAELESLSTPCKKVKLQE